MILHRFIGWLKRKLRRCAQDGCWREGNVCFLPENQSWLPDEWVCGEHAHGAGYCRSCGQFWGGVDSFEFSRSGLCEHCRQDDFEQFAEEDYYEDF